MILQFKVGQSVRYVPNSIAATIIVVDTSHPGGYYLLGWKKGEGDPSLGWYLRGKDDVAYPFDTRRFLAVNNLKDYVRAYWVAYWHLEALTKFSKVNRKTLQKRMRDQIAQLVLTGKS